jgi:phage replication initiation protein
MYATNNLSNSQTNSGSADVSTIGSPEPSARASGDGTAAAPGRVIPGESFQRGETPNGGESLSLVAIAGQARLIAHPQPLPESPADGAITDYLNCTFPFPSTDIAVRSFFRDLIAVAGQQFVKVESRRKGMNGYQRSFDLGTFGAKFCYGGQRSTALLMLPGQACRTIPDWSALVELLRDKYEARITRWDGAVDDFYGVHSVDWAVEQYLAGNFTNGGNKPSCNQVGNWIEPDGKGRTFYVGKRKNGKMLRVYEKGMQLGGEWHPWVRWEIELHNIDRVIPWEVLLTPGQYLAGSYPMVTNWIDTAMSDIETVAKEGNISYDHLVHYAGEAYGRLVNVMLTIEGSPERLVERLWRDGKPARLRLPDVPKQDE